jgi:endonuclease YncB( thermonuclease family)
MIVANVLLAVIQACYDGDTCTVSIPNVHDIFGKDISVRISKIDAPEINGRCQAEKEAAIRAKEYLQAHLPHGAIVQLLSPTRDKYFRINADIQFGEWTASTNLLASGLARAYNGGKRESWC